MPRPLLNLPPPRHNSTLVVSILLAIVTFSCASEEAPIVCEGSDSAVDCPDASPVTCEGPNPAFDCAGGCHGNGEYCQLVDGCRSSECWCGSDGEWTCNADCNRRYECRPGWPEACPLEPPENGDACGSEPEWCAYGSLPCCSWEIEALSCICAQDEGWQCDDGQCLNCFGVPCEDSSDCATTARPHECIDGACALPPAPAGWSASGRLPLAAGCDTDVTLSDYTFTYSAVRDGAVRADVHFAGGCEPHQFRACWSGEFASGEPPAVTIDVQHRANGDTCERTLQSPLSVDLEPIKQAYEQAFGESGPLRVEWAGETFDVRW